MENDIYIAIQMLKKSQAKGQSRIDSEVDEQDHENLRKIEKEIRQEVVCLKGKVGQLKVMGFVPEDAAAALFSSNGDLQEAIDELVEQDKRTEKDTQIDEALVMRRIHIRIMNLRILMG